MRTTFFFIVFVFWSSNCPAQWSDTLNSIIHGKVSPTASFDSRNSFINASKAHIWGVKIGVEFSEKLQGGIGYNRHDKNLSKEIIFLDQAGLPHSNKAFLHLSYFSFYLRYAYYNNNKWKFSIMPYQLGCGNSDYQYVENGNKIITDRQLVVIYEPGISVSYKFFPWLGVGGDVGYRFMLRNNYAIPENFNSPIFS
ncbi:MAG: hypothetical protein EXR20_03445, partial [Bacteroidetes bacterium]|nr:hypothetical protein [Bacteroidota bacterium]